MILIVQDAVEASLELNGVDIRWKESKKCYKKLVDAYNTNFLIWLEVKNKLLTYQALKAGDDRDFLSPNSYNISINKLKDEFDRYRPYYYELEGKYYFLRSRLRTFKEANIFEIEPTDILATLEDSLQGLDFLTMKRRRYSKINFITSLNAHNTSITA